MQHTPPQTRSQGPAQHPLDPDINRRRRTPADLRSSLKPVPGSTTRHRHQPIDPMSQIPDSPSPSRGRSNSTRRQTSRLGEPAESESASETSGKESRINLLRNRKMILLNFSSSFYKLWGREEVGMANSGPLA